MHELGLAKTERALQEKLDECRRKHDNTNQVGEVTRFVNCVEVNGAFLVIIKYLYIQDREANLDIIMDRMRQDASENVLQDSLKKALCMLENIRKGSAILVLIVIIPIP